MNPTECCCLAPSPLLSREANKQTPRWYVCITLLLQIMYCQHIWCHLHCWWSSSHGRAATAKNKTSHILKCKNLMLYNLPRPSTSCCDLHRKVMHARVVRCMIMRARTKAAVMSLLFTLAVYIMHILKLWIMSMPTSLRIRFPSPTVKRLVISSTATETPQQAGSWKTHCFGCKYCYGLHFQWNLQP